MGTVFLDRRTFRITSVTASSLLHSICYTQCPRESPAELSGLSAARGSGFYNRTLDSRYRYAAYFVANALEFDWKIEVKRVYTPIESFVTRPSLLSRRLLD